MKEKSNQFGTFYKNTLRHCVQEQDHHLQACFIAEQIQELSVELREEVETVITALRKRLLKNLECFEELELKIKTIAI